MKKTRPALLVIALVGAGLPVAAMASPCGTELCLSDFRAAANAQECKQETDEFFEIIKFRHGKPHAGRTRKARRNYLDRCESGNTAEKAGIIATFGAIYKSPY